VHNGVSRPALAASTLLDDVVTLLTFFLVWSPSFRHILNSILLLETSS